jgi:hypothetical protein
MLGVFSYQVLPTMPCLLASWPTEMRWQWTVGGGASGRWNPSFILSPGPEYRA